MPHLQLRAFRSRFSWNIFSIGTCRGFNGPFSTGTRCSRCEQFQARRQGAERPRVWIEWCHIERAAARCACCLRAAFSAGLYGVFDSILCTLIQILKLNQFNGVRKGQNYFSNNILGICFAFYINFLFM